jgi:hypothetical protein
MPESRPVSICTVGGGPAAIADAAYSVKVNPASKGNACAVAVCMAANLVVDVQCGAGADGKPMGNRRSRVKRQLRIARRALQRV